MAQTRLDPELLPVNTTFQGNAFNGSNELVQLDGSGRLPAIDGSQLTGVSGGSAVGGTGDLQLNNAGAFGNANSIDPGSSLLYSNVYHALVCDGIVSDPYFRIYSNSSPIIIAAGAAGGSPQPINLIGDIGNAQTAVTVTASGLTVGALTPSIQKMDVEGSVYVNGSVGIHISHPLYPLDVAGQARIADGTQASGYVFTSDASGLGSWQAPGATPNLAGGNTGQIPFQSAPSTTAFDSNFTYADNSFLGPNGKFITMYGTGARGGITGFGILNADTMGMLNGDTVIVSDQVTDGRIHMYTGGSGGVGPNVTACRSGLGGPLFGVNNTNPLHAIDIGGDVNTSTLYMVGGIQVLTSGSTTNSVVVGNGSSSLVGVNTTAPTSPLQVVGLPSYANNAAALSGGLTTGAFYTDGASDPRQVYVVF